MLEIPFIGQAYTNRSRPLSAQECINLYPEVNQEAKSVIALHGTPGTTKWATVGDGPIRGMHIMNDVLYVVSGTELYSVTHNGTSTLIGTIEGDHRVSMADNGTQLAIVNGDKGYTYTTTLAEITDADFFPSDHVGFVDGFFIFNRADTGQFFSSESYDGTTFDGLDFDTAGGHPDNIRQILIDHRQIWIFGEHTTEIWWNAGVSGFPFQRQPGAFIEKGIASKWSAAKLDNTVYWLGSDLMVYRAVGVNPQRISTHPIEYAIKQYSKIDDAFAYTYEDEGHSFYVLTFPSANRTWVYDASTNLWHERRTGTARHVSNTYSFFNNTHLVGDHKSGKIFEMSLDVYTDDGEEIISTRTANVLHSSGNRIFMSELWVDMETGAGVTTGQGSDPQAMLSWSDDGGRTFRDEIWRDIGKKGEYYHRVRWHALGSFYNRIFRLSISDPIKKSIIGAHSMVDVEDG